MMLNSGGSGGPDGPCGTGTAVTTTSTLDWAVVSLLRTLRHCRNINMGRTTPVVLAISLVAHSAKLITLSRLKTRPHCLCKKR